ncbi:Uncharacterised protein [Zhongshania aliphaticivorans]|uniref:Uncharacterized protein n=1 Tax=Zhongshania aliphaticivorans TaxID=1470434 RepID=A0A5S9N5I6_9GAMM|nr:hypothetical protein [Zhongshania aliphaticivorans]CAA0081321.1 Uncharacterised protein [Zhongshania aliphaticivorans]CAA0085119.1 Uncharacterised protein [Zhongshania aliphaticivorans]
MPLLIYPAIGLAGWVLGFFSSDGVTNVLRMALIIFTLMAFFFAYKALAG